MGEKNLVSLEAAMEAARTARVTFVLGERIEFTLHVPNMAALLALHADLVEEARCNEALGALLQAEDLEAAYPKIAPEITIAKRLLAALGRPVEALAPAECLCGLKEGVEEHDRERMQSAMEMSDRLGLTSKLQRSIDLAKQEIERLRGGLALEQQLRLDLKNGRSKHEGGGKWAHGPIETAALEKSLAAAAAFPLISKAGVRLMRLAEAALQLRAMIRKDDWAGLAALLRGMADVEVLGSEEVEAAKTELSDMHAVYIRRLEEAMGAGRAVRVAHGSWDRGQLSTTELLAATTALANFPAETEAGATLLAQAGFVASMRKEMLDGCGNKADTWQGLDALLQAPCSRTGTLLLQAASLLKLEEVRAAEQELGEFLENLEKAVRAALATGRSTKSVGKWSHEGITTTALTATLAELQAFPRTSDAGKALAAQAAFVVQLREALLVSDWAKAATWAGLSELLETPTAAALPTCTELGAARQEFGEMRQATEDKTSTELDAHRAVRQPDGSWDHSEIATAALKAASAELEAFPRMGDAGRALAALATFVVPLREALLGCRWGVSAGWGAVVELLEVGAANVSAAQAAQVLAEKSEVKAALQEVGEMRAFTEEAVRAALATGRSTKSVGKWSHEGITTTALTATLAELQAFPRTSDAGKALAAQAAFVVQLREALLVSDWAKAATWAGLSDLLHGNELSLLETAAERGGAEAWDASEVAAAREELEGKRAETEAVLKGPMDSGRSVRSGTLKHAQVPVWEHGGIETEALLKAAAEVEDFPRLTEAAKLLASGAREVASLRTLLRGCSWEDAATWGGLASFLDEMRDFEMQELEEVKAAAEELLDMRVNTEEATRADLATGRSVKPPDADEWSHSALSTTSLTASLQQLRAFPRVSDVGRAL